MKKFLAIFIAILLIGCTKSDHTNKTQNNNTKDFFQKVFFQNFFLWQYDLLNFLPAS